MGLVIYRIAQRALNTGVLLQFLRLVSVHSFLVVTVAFLFQIHNNVIFGVMHIVHRASIMYFEFYSFTTIYKHFSASIVEVILYTNKIYKRVIVVFFIKFFIVNQCCCWPVLVFLYGMCGMCTLDYI